VGEYHSPSEMQDLLNIYTPEGKINLLYSLHSLRQDRPFLDDSPHLKIGVLGGDYRHIFALSQAIHSPCSEASAFQEKFNSSWWPIERSPLYHNVNCEIVIITADEQILLTKRNTLTPFYPGAWSASIEEQMLRLDPLDGTQDKNLFDCAHRGAREELGIDIDTERTSLLSVGIEWGNFTAAFLMLIWSFQTFEKLARSWIGKAHDPYEINAVDCIPASAKGIQKALTLETWSPSDRVLCRMPDAQKLENRWHLTSRARLQTCMKHLEHLGY
jgi:hypothetical protein